MHKFWFNIKKKHSTLDERWNLNFDETENTIEQVIKNHVTSQDDNQLRIQRDLMIKALNLRS